MRGPHLFHGSASVLTCRHVIFVERTPQIKTILNPRSIDCSVGDSDSDIMPTDWWANIFTAMTTLNFEDLIRMESRVDKNTSWGNIALLMECADQHQFLQYAYEQRKRGMLHVEFIVNTD